MRLSSSNLFEIEPKVWLYPERPIPETHGEKSDDDMRWGLVISYFHNVIHVILITVDSRSCSYALHSLPLTYLMQRSLCLQLQRKGPLCMLWETIPCFWRYVNIKEKPKKYDTPSIYTCINLFQNMYLSHYFFSIFSPGFPPHTHTVIILPDS